MWVTINPAQTSGASGASLTSPKWITILYTQTLRLYPSKWLPHHLALWIQTLSEKVLNSPNYSKLYPKHFLRRYLDP